MSLINQMLKDLEARRAEGGGTRPAVLVRPRSGPLPWIVAGLLGVAVIFLGILLWQQQSQADDPAVTEQRTAAAAGQSDAAAETGSKTGADMQQAAEPATGDGNGTSVTTPTGTAAASDKPAATEPAETETPEKESVASATAGPADTGGDASDATEPATRTEPEPVAVTTPAAEKQRDTSRDTETAEQEGSFSIAPSTTDPREQAQRNIERGLDAVRRGEHRRAAEHLQAGLAILPREDEARLALHTSLRRQGRIAEAEDVLETGLVEAREPYRFAAVLARLHAARGNVDEAVTLLKLDPPAVADDPEYHALWGALLQQQGDYSAALPVYEQLAEHQPGNAQWLAGLGIARQQTGDEQGAVAVYRRALQTRRLTETLADYIQDQLDRLAPEED